MIIKNNLIILLSSILMYSNNIFAAEYIFKIESKNIEVSTNINKEEGYLGVCGNAINQIYLEKPTENLCSTEYGNSSVLENDTTFYWNCNGSPETIEKNKGKSVECSAIKEQPSPENSIETKGWLHFATYGFIYYVDSQTWQNAVNNMSIGIKIVNLPENKFSFIPKENLLNARCRKPTQTTDLNIIRTATDNTQLLYWDEPDCNRIKTDYSYILLKDNQPIYDHTKVYTIKHCTTNICGFTNNTNTKYYIK